MRAVAVSLPAFHRIPISLVHEQRNTFTEFVAVECEEKKLSNAAEVGGEMGMREAHGFKMM